jgi:nicotinate-nucleotide adenylyltransferase
MVGPGQRSGAALSPSITTGLLGGSFNPAHAGHRAISLKALSVLELDELWWMVSPGNPLKKGASDMAALADRFASAQSQSRRTRIRATAIEREFGTVYTVETLRKLVARYPKRRFIWIIGSDNLAQLHKWKQWRRIARIMPIAVIARPGYDTSAIAVPAMAWLRRFVHRTDQHRYWTHWSTPALVYLRFRPDPHSATAIRRADPHWHKRYSGRQVRDDVTHKLLR